MKNVLKTVISVMLVLCLAVPANAQVMLSFGGENSDVTSNTVHFTGSFGGEKTNRAAILYILKQGTTEISQDNILHVQSSEVSYYGDFDFEFNFPNDSGVYPVRIFCENETYSDDYKFKKWSDIQGFLAKCKNKTVTFQDISDFEDILCVNVSDITDINKQNVFVKRIGNNCTAINYDVAGLTKVKQVVNSVFEEFENLEKIKTVQNWSYIPGILEDLTKLTNISFDFKTADKKSVCDAIMLKSFNDTESLSAEFITIVNGLIGGGGNGSNDGEGTNVTTGGGGGSFVMPSGIMNSGSEVQNENNNNSGSFEDIQSVPWAVKAINYLYNKGIINGVSDREFAPNDLVTREQLVKIAVLAFGLYDENAVCTFSDVPRDAWYAPYAASAQSAGIVKGMENNLFGTGKAITRQDMAVILKNSAQMAGYAFESKKNDFADWGSIASYAQESVEALAGEGHINGMDNNMFNPNQNATRAQAAKIIYSIIGGEN